MCMLSFFDIASYIIIYEHMGKLNAHYLLLLQEKTKSRNSLNFSASPSDLDETDANCSAQLANDVNFIDSAKRRQFDELEQERKRAVEEAVNSKAAQFRAHSLKIRAALEERARQREKERQEEEAAIKAEIDEVDTTERNRTSLVLQLQNKLNDEHEKVKIHAVFKVLNSSIYFKILESGQNH